MLSGAYRVDRLSQFFKLMVATGFTFSVLNARHHPTLPDDKRADYFLLIGISVLGLMICLRGGVDRHLPGAGIQLLQSLCRGSPARQGAPGRRSRHQIHLLRRRRDSPGPLRLQLYSGHPAHQLPGRAGGEDLVLVGRAHGGRRDNPVFRRHVLQAGPVPVPFLGAGCLSGRQQRNRHLRRHIPQTGCARGAGATRRPPPGHR